MKEQQQQHESDIKQTSLEWCTLFCQADEQETGVANSFRV